MKPVGDRFKPGVKPVLGIGVKPGVKPVCGRRGPTLPGVSIVGSSR